MAHMKNSGFFRIVSLVLITTFIAFDISWAYPSSPSEKTTLAIQGLFQQQMMTPDGAMHRDAIFSNMRLFTSVRSIAKILLTDKVRLKYLDSTLTAELGKVLVEGMDLSRVAVKDSVVLVPYVSNNKRYVIQIALKGTPEAQTLKGYEWPALDKDSDIYVIKVLPEDKASGEKAYPAEDGRLKVITGLRKGEVSRIADGVERIALSFDRGNTSVSGDAFFIEPSKVEVEQVVDKDVRSRDIIDKPMSDPNQPASGKIVEKYVEAAQHSENIILAFNGHQGGFWDANSLIIKNGELVAKSAGARGIFQQVYSPLNGTFWVLGLDKDRTSIYEMKLKEGMATGALPVMNGISGQPLMINGVSMLGSIKFNALPSSNGNEINWPSQDTRMAVSAIGYSKDGRLVRVALKGDPDGEKMKEASLKDLIDVLQELGVINAVLTGTSADVQTYYTTGEETKVKHNDRARARAKSTTGDERFPDGRPIGNCILVRQAALGARLVPAGKETDGTLTAGFGGNFSILRAPRGAILPVTRPYPDAKALHRNNSPAYTYNGKEYGIQDRWVPRSQHAAVQEIGEEQLLWLALTRPGWKVVVAEDYDMMTYGALYVAVHMMELANREFALGLATGGTTETYRKAMGLLDNSARILDGLSIPADKVNKWSTLDNYYWPRGSQDIDVALSSYTQEQQYMLLNNLYGRVDYNYFVTPFDKTSLTLNKTAQDFRTRMRVFLDESYRILIQLHGIGSDGHDAFNEIYAHMALLRKDYGATLLGITQVQNIGHFLPEDKGFHPFFLRFMADNYIFSIERLTEVLKVLGFENIRAYYGESKYQFKAREEFNAALDHMLNNYRLTPAQAITQGTGDIAERTGTADSLNLFLSSNYHKAIPLYDAVELTPSRWNTGGGLQLYASSLVITDLDAATRGRKRLDLSRAFFFVPEGRGRALAGKDVIEETWKGTKEGARIQGLLEEKHGPKAAKVASEALFGEKAYPAEEEKTEGLLFLPSHDFKQGEPLDAALIKTKRGAEDARKLLFAAGDRKIELSISGHLRGVDGAGSSLDLPEFQKKLTEAGVTNPVELPSTPTIASAFSVKIRFEAADDPDVIEYVAPDYGITAQSPYRVYGPIKLNKDGKTPGGQKDAPAFIFRNIFRLKGIRIICEEVPPMALAGGMESSNMFNVALISAASMLSGAELSLADIFSLAVKLENDEFNGLTGGQGHLSSMLGGAYRNVWLSGVKDAAGKSAYPYAAFSVPLLKGDDLAAIEEHMALVQAGKEYKDGKALVGRTATLINWMWTDLLRDEDAIGAPLHRGKLALAAEYTRALREKDFKTAADMINQYVDTRDKLCLRWMNLMLDAHEDKKEAPGHAKRYARDVFDENSSRYKDYEIIRVMLADKGGDFLRSTSLYTLEPIASLMKKAREHGIAIMPLGAGGPGANLIAVSSVGSKHLKDFLEAEGVTELNDAAARAVIHGDGLLRGYIPFKVGKDPVKFNGFGDLGLSEPQKPVASEYDQAGGKISQAAVTHAAKFKDEAPENLVVSPITKNTMGITGAPIEKSHHTYRIDKNVDPLPLIGAYRISQDISEDLLQEWRWQIDACLDQICAGIVFPNDAIFPNIIDMKVVSGLSSLSEVVLDKDSNKFTILLDEELLKSLDAKWLLYMELENKLLRMCIRSLKNRLPPAAEDIALTLVYLARFNSFEERKRQQTIAFLNKNPNLDAHKFRDVLIDSQGSSSEEMAEKIAIYHRRKSLSCDQEWLKQSMPIWCNAMALLAYSNILANLLKQDIFIAPQLKIGPPQPSKAFWSATEWTRIFESMSARLAGLKGEKEKKVQTVDMRFSRFVRGRENMSLNIPARLTGREYLIIARLIMMYINDHIVNEGSSDVSITTSDLRLRAAIENMLRGDYKKTFDYVKQYYQKPESYKVVRFVNRPDGDVRPYKKNIVIGLDLGGSSKVKAVAIENGQIIYSGIFLLPDKKEAENLINTDEYVDAFAGIIRDVIAKSRIMENRQDKKENEIVYSVGISWAGAVNDKGFICATSKIINKLSGNAEEKGRLARIRNLGGLLSKKTGLHVRMVNDGDALAFGLATYAEMKDTLCLGFGTSLAVGYIDENGRLVSEFGEGSKTIADMADDSAVHTGTGVSGVTQQYASQSGVIRVAEGYGEFQELLKKIAVKDKAARVGKLVELYNVNGEAVLDKAADFIAVAIARLHRHYRMEHVILSGGVMNRESGAVILAKVREKIRANFPVVDPANIETSGTIEKMVEGMKEKVETGKAEDSKRLNYSDYANAIGAAQNANQKRQDEEHKLSGEKKYPAGEEAQSAPYGEMLKSKEADVRLDAIEALGDIGSAARDTIPAIIEVLEDEYKESKDYGSEVRYYRMEAGIKRIFQSAADALVKIGGRTVIPVLANIATAGPRQEARAAAYNMLAELDAVTNEISAKRYISDLADENSSEEARNTAMKELRKMNRSEALEALKKCLTDRYQNKPRLISRFRDYGEDYMPHSGDDLGWEKWCYWDRVLGQIVKFDKNTFSGEDRKKVAETVESPAYRLITEIISELSRGGIVFGAKTSREGEESKPSSVAPLYDPKTKGTSFGLDDFGRNFSRSGQLKEIISAGGVMNQTSNQTLFLRAIAEGYYDEDMLRLSSQGHTAEEIYNMLYTEEALEAADMFKPIFHKTDGLEGRVAREVDPRSANETAPTIEEAKELWNAARQRGVDNLLIKIAGTDAGVSAVRMAASEGIDTITTLVFTHKQYLDTVEGYIKGLEERVERGQDISHVNSLCATFVSRIDKKIDSLLDKELAKWQEQLAKAVQSGASDKTDEAHVAIRNLSTIKGKVAIAHIKKLYQMYDAIFNGKAFDDPANLYGDSQNRIGSLADRFRSLREKGARAQRILIASSGVKDDNYSSFLYVLPLLGPYLQNTLPPKTLEILRNKMAELSPETVLRQTIYDDIPYVIQEKSNRDKWDGYIMSGNSGKTITPDAVLELLRKAGIDISAAGRGLLDEGIASFVESQNKSLATISGRIDMLKAKEGEEAKETKILEALAQLVRRDVVNMIADAGSGHPGGSLSCVEEVVASYMRMMDFNAAEPSWENRTRFIVSKGHAAATVYSLLSHLGYIDRKELMTFRKFGTRLQGMAHKDVPGVDFSTGTLGQGLSAGVGMALGAKLLGKGFKTIVIVGDGEEQEGQISEAARHAAAARLDNLYVFLDVNRYQISGATADVDIADREMVWKGYGFNVIPVKDGNNMQEVLSAMKKAEEIQKSPDGKGKPTLFMSYTIKGKGVSFMEDTEKWHGKAPKAGPQEAGKAILEIDSRLSAVASELGVRAEDIEGLVKKYIEDKRIGGKRRESIDSVNAGRHPVDPLVEIAPLKQLEPGVKLATRKAFGEMLVQLGLEYPQLVATSADLTASLMMLDFQKAFPDRFIASTGIREAHMTSMGEGLAAVGLIPVIATYDMYQLNAAPQIRHMVHEGLPVMIVSSHSGLSHTEDGESHEGEAAPGLMDIFAGASESKLLEMFEPCDAEETRVCMRIAMDTLTMKKKPVYLRLARNEAPVIDKRNIISDYEALVKQGAYIIYDENIEGENIADAIIVASGTMVAPAVEAAKALHGSNLRVKVINAVSLDKINGKGAIVDILRNERKGIPILTACDAVGSILQGKVALAVKEADLPVGRIIGKGITRYGTGKSDEMWKLNGLDKEGLVRSVLELGEYIFSADKRIKIALSAAEDYIKYQKKNDQATCEYGVTMVSGLPMSESVLKTRKAIEDVLTEALKKIEKRRAELKQDKTVNAQSLSIYEDHHTHSTISSIIRGTDNPITGLVNSKGRVDMDKALDAVRAAKPFVLKLSGVVINGRGEIVLTGEATEDTKENLIAFRKNLINEANFDGRASDQNASIHTAIGYIEDFDRLAAEEKQAICQAVEGAIKELPDLGTLSVDKAHIIYYLHRSMSKIINKVELVIGADYPDLRGKVEGLLLAKRTSLPIKAAIFDLDGVVTATAKLHKKKWKETFDELLEKEIKPRLASRAQILTDIPSDVLREFTEEDYRTHVDGIDRFEGVAAFLESRGITIRNATDNYKKNRKSPTAEQQALAQKVSIEIDWGAGDPEPAGSFTVCGIGNTKNDKFNEALKVPGAVQVYDGTIALIKELRRQGAWIGVASSSKNCRSILKCAGITHLFDARVDGTVSKKKGLSSKPSPDIFIEAARRFSVNPSEAIVFEDAEKGVEAGAAGNFGLVVGIAREGNEKALKEKGADVVVDDLDRLRIGDLLREFESNKQGPGEKAYPAEGSVKTGAAGLFEILESQVNNERTEIVASANKIITTMLGNEEFRANVGVVKLDKSQATAALKDRIERAISAVESLGAKRVPAELQATVGHLKKRMDQLEADGIVASVINRARKAKYENQKLIIGLETDWIPGYNDRGSLQRQAMNPVVQQIESIPDILRAMGLDNVVLVHANSKDIADSLIKEADKTNNRLSNMVILASKGTVESASFNSLRSTPTEARAFIAAIDPADLEKFFKTNKDPLKQLDIKILEMLSIALDIAAGKEPPQIPMVGPYNRALRMIMLIPKAEPKDYGELNRNYYARRAALAAA